MLVRFAGVNDTAAREIFAQAGVEYYGEEISMSMAGKKMMEKMKQAYPGGPQSERPRWMKGDFAWEY